MLDRYAQNAYRQAASNGASQIGLMLLAYDALARDLNRAAMAARAQDVQGRCIETNHALLILGHLETWTVYLDDPVLRGSLVGFYSVLRGGILEAQAREGSSRLEALACLVLDIRATLQQKEMLLNAVALDVAGEVCGSPEERLKTSGATHGWSA